MADIRIGTCSWNYDSWVGLVYTKKQIRSAEYLREYSRKYNTVEIDSWFYKIPDPDEVNDYLSNVTDDFRFTCKVFEGITLTHKRNSAKQKVLIENEFFLSEKLFTQYVSSIQSILSRIDAIMLQFEYLNKEKMSSVKEFIKRIDSFVASVGSGLPLAIEIRNSNYLTEDYFAFLNHRKLIPVFTEKIFMPHVYEVYQKFRKYINTDVVIRLLGGDRKEIEEKTNGLWNSIVERKSDKKEIAKMALDMKNDGHNVTINVNNHYEGSAPLTIEELSELIKNTR